MKLDTQMFRVARFLWQIIRVRSVAGTGKFNAARQRLARIEAPQGYSALKEAFDARLASLAYAANVTFEGLAAHPPDKMLNLISVLQTQRWYWAPKDENERFCSRYLDYVEAAILGDGDKRDGLARELTNVPANRFFKAILVVT
ncbi:hypothetical protein ACUXST_000310 [Sphingomonas sp. F9_3S_D5_B_2]